MTNKSKSSDTGQEGIDVVEERLLPYGWVASRYGKSVTSPALSTFEKELEGTERCHVGYCSHIDNLSHCKIEYPKECVQLANQTALKKCLDEIDIKLKCKNKFHCRGDRYD